MNKLYPNKLKEYRLKAGLTQKQVAKLLGLQCENRLCRWEQGQATPGIKNVISLSKIYKVTINELFNQMPYHYTQE